MLLWFWSRSPNPVQVLRSAWTRNRSVVAQVSSVCLPGRETFSKPCFVHLLPHSVYYCNKTVSSSSNPTQNLFVFRGGLGFIITIMEQMYTFKMFFLSSSFLTCAPEVWTSPWIRCDRRSCKMFVRRTEADLIKNKYIHTPINTFKIYQLKKSQF